MRSAAQVAIKVSLLDDLLSPREKHVSIHVLLHDQNMESALRARSHRPVDFLISGKVNERFADSIHAAQVYETQPVLALRWRREAPKE